MKKEKLIKVVRSGISIPDFEGKLILDSDYTNSLLHIYENKDISDEEFILSSLWHYELHAWYGDIEDFIGHLENCKFEPITIEEAAKVYESIFNAHQTIVSSYCRGERPAKFYDSYQGKLPPKYEYYHGIEKCIHISDIWYKKSLYLKTKNLHICAHWSTSE